MTIPSTQAIVQNLYVRLEELRMQADDALNDLRNASFAEHQDTQSSNWSMWGWLTSNYSYSRNYAAADKVDRVGLTAYQLNELILGIAQTLPGARFLSLLPTVSGQPIRQAENNEHTFMQWLCDGSTAASAFTQSQIQETMSRVNAIRDQALRMMQMLPTISSPMPQMMQFNPMMPTQQPMMMPPMPPQTAAPYCPTA